MQESSTQAFSVVLRAVTRFAEQKRLPVGTVTSSTLLVDLGISSIDLLDLFLEAERQLGTRVFAASNARVASVGDLAALFEREG